jgi:hypothetical protein
MFNKDQLTVVAAYIAALMVKSGAKPSPQTTEEKSALIQEAGTDFVAFLIKIGKIEVPKDTVLN